jgi:adenine-specific DNA-methyltransferase
VDQIRNTPSFRRFAQHLEVRSTFAACAFNYEAHATEFSKLGRIPVLKARMNADLHMAEDLKATGKGNLFVIFGEPDITVVSGQWSVVGSQKRKVNCEL